MRQVTQFRFSGIIRDLPPAVVPLDHWTGGQNISFESGLAEAFRAGARALTDSTPTAPLARPYYVQPWLTDSQAYWFYAGRDGTPAEKIYRTTGAPPDTDVTPGAGWGATPPTGRNVYTGGILNGIPFMNNGVDTPVYWSTGATAFAVLPLFTGTWTTCRALRAFKYHLVAMDMVTGGTRYADQLAWSAAAAAGAIPATWAPAAGNEAGNTLLADRPGAIVDGAPLGNDFLVYKQHACYVMSWVGGNYVFQFRPLFSTLGCLARNCIVEVKGRHLVLADGDIVAIDGVNAESLLKRRQARWFFNQLDSTKIDGCHAVYDRRNQQVLFFGIRQGVTDAGATRTHADIALILDVLTGKWSHLELTTQSAFAAAGVLPGSRSLVWDNQTQTWDSENVTWDQAAYDAVDEVIIRGLPESSVATSYLASLNTGRQAVAAWVERVSLPVGDPTQHKGFDELWPIVDAPHGTVLYVSVGRQKYANGPVVWGTEQALTLGEDAYKIDVRASGTHLAFKVRGESGIYPWRCAGFDLVWHEQGIR